MRSVSHCGQTIGFSIHPIKGGVREATLIQPRGKKQKHHRGSYCPFFPPPPLSPSDEIPMERPEFNRVLRLILTSFSSAPEHSRDSPDSATVSFFLVKIPKPPAIPDPLHGWNDHPRDRLQAVSVSAGACGRRGVLGSDDRGKCALLLDGSRHHVGWGEGEDAGGAAAVGGQAGR